MSEKKRRKIMVDWGRWQTILKKVGSRTKPGVISVYVALENVCFEQRSERGGNVCVASAPFIASMAGVHEDTVEHHVHLLEEIGVVRIKQSYNVRKKQYHENHYTLLLAGGRTDRLGVAEVDSTSESPALSKEKGGHQNATAADAASTLTLRHFDVPLLKDIEAAQAAKREAAAKYKAEQLAEAEEIRKNHAAEAEQLAERRRLMAEKEKADKDAAQLAEDARRLAMRADVGSCKEAIVQASFGFYDPSWSHDDPQAFYLTVWKKYNCETVMAALKKLTPIWTEKVKGCIRECEYIFDDAPKELTMTTVVEHAAHHAEYIDQEWFDGHVPHHALHHVSAIPRSPATF